MATQLSLERIGSFEGHPQGGAECVCFSPDGRLLASSGQVVGAVPDPSDQVLVWDLTSGALLRSFATDHAYITALAFDPTNTLLATGSFDGKVYKHRGFGEPVRSYGVGKVQVLDLGRPEPLLTAETPNAAIDLVELSPDSRSVIASLRSPSGDRELRQWALATGRESVVLEASKIGKRPVASSGSGLLATAGTAHIDLWRLSKNLFSQKIRARHRRRIEHPSVSLDHIAVSPTGAEIAYSSRGIHLMNRKREWHQVRTGPVHHLTFSPEGTLLAMIDFISDGFALAAVDDGRLLLTKEDHLGSGIAFSADGNHVATAGRPGVTLWRLRR